MPKHRKKQPPPADRWLVQRPYPHFDRQPSQKFLLKYVPDPDKISRHAFYPFIRRVSSTTRFKASPGGARKKGSKDRPICYASHIDSHIYAYYAYHLSTLYEADLVRRNIADEVLAYRRLGKSNADFAANAFRDVQQQAPCCAIAIDISKYFDTIDHRLLKRRWASLLGGASLPPDHYALFKNLTKYAYIDYSHVERYVLKYERREKRGGQLFDCTRLDTDFRKRGLIIRNPKDFGIPQGSPISAVLSNLFLGDYDCQIKALVTRLGGTYRRYCDDILLVVPTSQATLALRAAIDGLRANLLAVNMDKVEMSEFLRSSTGAITTDAPLQYLGFIFDGTTALLRGSTLAKYHRRMKEGVRALVSLWSKQTPNAPAPIHGLYERYTHLGSRNFFSYAKSSSAKLGDPAPQRQLRAHWDQLQNHINEELEERDDEA